MKKLISMSLFFCVLFSVMVSAGAIVSDNLTPAEYLEQIEVQAAIHQENAKALANIISGEEITDQTEIENPIIKKIINTPDIYAEYIENVEARQDAAQPERIIFSNDGKTKIEVFADGSFVTSNSTVQEEYPIVTLRDPADLEIHRTEDFESSIYALYKVAEFHLITELYYGNYWVDIVDTTPTAKTYSPAKLDSKSSSVVYDKISTAKTKAVFNLHDTLGSFGRTMTSTFEAGPFTLEVDNEIVE